MVMGSKYGSCLGLVASAIILDRVWKGNRVKSGWDSKVVISLVKQCNARWRSLKKKDSQYIENCNFATHGLTGDKVSG